MVHLRYDIGVRPAPGNRVTAGNGVGGEEVTRPWELGDSRLQQVRGEEPVGRSCVHM